MSGNSGEASAVSPSTPAGASPGGSTSREGRRRSKAPSEEGPLSPLRRVTKRLETAVHDSPADQSEVLWIESRRARVAQGVAEAETYDRKQCTVQARVIEHGRPGVYRTVGSAQADLGQAVRYALANATTSPARKLPPFPAADEPFARARAFDSSLATLEPPAAQARLGTLAREDEAAILEWACGQVSVVNSNGLRRWCRATSAFLQVRSGEGIGAGFATDASRFLEDLDAQAVFERARSRRSSAQRGALGDASGIPLVLAPEATAALLDLLNHQAFGSEAYRQGHSFLRQHLGVQVFAQSLTLRDDGTDPAGLPFPFDLEGRTKAAVLLVERGVPRTPTVDLRSAMEFGLEPTSHCVSDDASFALNLFMEPGVLREEELLQLADGGVWVSRLEAIECFDPARVLLRARARGVRRIFRGELTESLPNLTWEDSLLRVFSDLRGFGRYTARRPSSDGFLGGLRAPAVVVGEASSLKES